MTTGGAPERASSRPSDRGALLALAAAMAAAFALLLWLGRDTGFLYDEWYFWAGYHPVTLGTLLEPGMTLHVIPGIWLADWGVVITESIRVTETGCEPLCNLPRRLFVKA